MVFYLAFKQCNIVLWVLICKKNIFLELLYLVVSIFVIADFIYLHVCLHASSDQMGYHDLLVIWFDLFTVRFHLKFKFLIIHQLYSRTEVQIMNGLVGGIIFLMRYCDLYTAIRLEAMHAIMHPLLSNVYLSSRGNPKHSGIIFHVLC